MHSILIILKIDSYKKQFQGFLKINVLTELPDHIRKFYYWIRFCQVYYIMKLYIFKLMFTHNYLQILYQYCDRYSLNKIHKKYILLNFTL